MEKNNKFLEVLNKFYIDVKEDYEKIHKSKDLSILDGRVLSKIRLEQAELLLNLYKETHKK